MNVKCYRCNKSIWISDADQYLYKIDNVGPNNVIHYYCSYSCWIKDSHDKDSESRFLWQYRNKVPSKLQRLNGSYWLKVFGDCYYNTTAFIKYLAQVNLLCNKQVIDKIYYMAKRDQFDDLVNYIENNLLGELDED